MTTDNTPPGEGDSGTHGTAAGTALTLLVAVSAASPACLLAVWLTPPSLRAAVAWASAACALLLCAAVAFAAHQRLTARRLRRHVAERDAAAAARRAAADHFADVTVPEVVQRLRAGASAETALAAVGRVADPARRRVLGALATEVHRGESGRAAAMAACAHAAGRVQALTTSMAADLREMEHRHDDPDVLGDLLHLDHRTAQAGRLADSIAVLTGARSGRRWAKPIRMESILRGAMGRIQGYQRVRLHSTSSVAVSGHAAEGVMHALAEIMDNAANFSPPTSEVHVYVEEVSAGVVVTVEDGGLVMGEVALRRARQAVEPRSARELDALPGTRLGLSVVGRLAYKHGLTVSFRPSAHGGTGVLLRIPQELVTDAAARSTGDTLGRGLPHPAARVRASASPTPSVSASAPTSASADGAEAAVRETPAGDGAAAAVPDQTAGPAEHELAREEGAGHRPQPGPASERPGAEEPHGAGAGRAPDAARHDPAPDGVGRPVEYGESGLPLRRRGRTLAAARRTSGDDADRRPRRARSAAEAGSRLGAFRRAVRGSGPGEPGRAPSSAAGDPAGGAGPGTDADPSADGDGARAPAAERPHTSPTSSPTRPEDDAQ